MNSNGPLQLWRNEVTDDRRTERSLSAFIEEENLDLNDIKSPRSVSPSASPLPMHLGNDFRMAQDTNTVYYDSAVSNIAANNDIEDEEDEYTPNPGNGHYSNDLEIPNTPNTRNTVNTPNQQHLPRSNFKIVVSAPNNEEIMNDRENELMSRLNPKRSRLRRYIPSEIESGASDDYSSTDDDDMTTDCDDEDDSLHHHLFRNALFLSDNNLKRGVYSSFGFSDSETDYLSAQSDDFDELTICYHNRNEDGNGNRNGQDRNIRNIRFRNHLQDLSQNDTNYLSDIGPSDIGSSDTECFSSNDSIPDSIPPPVHPDFVSIN